jgi:hypothetical protein
MRDDEDVVGVSHYACHCGNGAISTYELKNKRTDKERTETKWNCPACGADNEGAWPASTRKLMDDEVNRLTSRPPDAP